MKTIQPTFFIFIILILFFSRSLTAQTTLLADSAVADTQAAAPAPKGRLQGPIKYWADKITLSDSGNVIHLQGKAKIVYQDMNLIAEDILIDRRLKTLYATGLADSLDADSNLAIRGKPVFSQKGQEPLYGDSIEYNFDTERGKIRMGKTKMEPGFYRGEKINRIADSTLLVQNGIFTSCSHIDHPHYYFKSSRIRLKIKDKVIAKPIVFYIADIPVGWLPFGIFPNKRGRHSGIVIPKYGENRAGGRFLRGMGYYWAPNDYFDATLLTDFYDKLGFAYRASAHYTKRYVLNGYVSGEYFPRDPASGGRSERWRFIFNHRHNIDPTMSLSGSGSFVSDRRFARDLSPNLADRLNQNITSNLTFSKRWQGTKNSLSLSASRNENLQTGRVSYTLPSMRFNHSQSSLFETLTGRKAGRSQSWYQKIYFSYNSNLIRKGAKVPTSDSTFSETQSQGIRHNFSFSAPQKIFKYFNLKPNISFKEDWVDEITVGQYNPSTQNIEERQKKQFAARHTFNTGLSAQTTVYGLFEPNFRFLKFLRHKLTPSVSFVYTPDFSTADYGYFNTVYDSSGILHKIDKFKKSPFGATSSRESKRLSIRIGNLFQGKRIDAKGKEKKFDLLTANMAASYNFKADSLRWSNISTNLSTRIWGKNININMVHSFYKMNKNKTGFINRFETFPQLLSLNTSLGFTLNERTFSGKKNRPKKKKTSPQSTEGILQSGAVITERPDYKEETKNIKIPWSTSFNFNYSYNKRSAVKERIDLSARANVQLTKNWKISWNAHFDLVQHRITTQRFNIYRNLHCWEMSFGWQPTIGYYDFQINIKASALQDIKLTKHPHGSSRFRY